MRILCDASVTGKNEVCADSMPRLQVKNEVCDHCIGAHAHAYLHPDGKIGAHAHAYLRVVLMHWCTCTCILESRAHALAHMHVHT